MSATTIQEIVQLLQAEAHPGKVAGMARFGINPSGTLGIGIPFLRILALKIGRDHGLAEELWATGIH